MNPFRWLAKKLPPPPPVAPHPSEGKELIPCIKCGKFDAARVKIGEFWYCTNCIGDLREAIRKLKAAGIDMGEPEQIETKLLEDWQE